MELSSLNVAVVGAGIGGVAVALALSKFGARVTVLEQSETLSEVGAGLQISQNGMVVLRALGVVDDEPPLAVRSKGTELRDYNAGRLILQVPPPKSGPTWYFHRADLLDLLVRGARQVGVAFDLGRQVSDVVAHSGTVIVNGAKRRNFDLVIAADGGQSPRRVDLNGTGKAQFSRQVAWRAVVPWDQSSPAASAVLSMGPGRHVVTYPLRGGTVMNVVAIEERDDWTIENWRQQGDPDELRDRFSDFGGRVSDILNRVDTVHLWALYLHPVAGVWHRDRLALLGDAAHPTLPFMAQGACLALEDAWTLAKCLDQAVTVDQGLAEYQRLRHPRATRVVATAAGNARKFHLSAPMNWLAQGALMAMGPRFAPRYAWIYGHDVTQT